MATIVRLRWPLVLGVIGAVLIASAGLIWYAFRPRDGIRVQDLKADFQRELRVGSSKAQVRAWFESHGIEVSSLVKDGVEVGLDARIPNDSLIETAEIRIECLFRDDQLRDWLIYRFVYSL